MWYGVAPITRAPTRMPGVPVAGDGRLQIDGYGPVQVHRRER